MTKLEQIGNILVKRTACIKKFEADQKIMQQKLTEMGEAFRTECEGYNLQLDDLIKEVEKEN